MLSDRSDLLFVVSAMIVAASALHGGAFSPRARLAVGLLLAAVAAWAVVGRSWSLESEELCGLGVILAGAVSAAANPGNPLASKEMLGAWLVTWLVFVVSRRGGERARNGVVAIVSVAAAVVSVAVLLESAGAGRLRVGGLLANPNVAASLIVPALPAVWLLWQPRHRRWIVPLSGVLIVGALATGSRAGLIALVAVVGCLLPTARLRALGVIVAAVAVAALLWWRFALQPDSLAWHRLAIWGALWDLVQQHPVLGIGPGWLEEATGVVRIAHEESIARYRHIIGSAESTPLGLLVRTGSVGLGLAIIGILTWVRSSSARISLRVRPALATVASVALLGVFHDVLDQDVVLWWWALLVGVSVPVQRSRADQRRVPQDAGVFARVVAALCLAGLILWGMVQPAYARRLWWSHPSSVDLARRVLRAEPWFAEAAQWRSRELLKRAEWTWEDAAEAIHWSSEAVRYRGGSAVVWSDYGLVHARVVEQLGAWPDAIERAREGFRQATELEPHLPWYWLRWAQLERGLGRLSEARRLVERALAEEPGFVRGWLFLARVELDLGQPDAAATAVERAVEANRRARWRQLSDYERDLTRLPAWQLEQLDRELAGLFTSRNMNP